MKRRNRSYSKPAGDSWSAVTVPATPSMSTEMYTFNFPAGVVPPYADPREATPNIARHHTSASTDAALEIRRTIFPPRRNGFQDGECISSKQRSRKETREQHRRRRVSCLRGCARCLRRDVRSPPPALSRREYRDGGLLRRLCGRVRSIPVLRATSPRVGPHKTDRLRRRRKRCPAGNHRALFARRGAVRLDTADRRHDSTYSN